MPALGWRWSATAPSSVQPLAGTPAPSVGPAGRSAAPLASASCTVCILDLHQNTVGQITLRFNRKELEPLIARETDAGRYTILEPREITDLARMFQDVESLFVVGENVAGCPQLMARLHRDCILQAWERRPQDPILSR